MKDFLSRAYPWILLVLVCVCRGSSLYAQSPGDAALLAKLGELRDATYNDKAKIIEDLGESGQPKVRPVLRAMLEERLYFRNNDQKVFLVKSAAQQDTTSLDLIDPITLKSAGPASIDSLTQIGINNHLRRVLETTLARYELSSSDASVRLDAAREIEKSLDESNIALLRERWAVEKNSKVKKEIATGLALAALNDGSDPKALLEAIATLRGSLNTDVRNRLQGLLDQNPDGTYLEPDAKVRAAASAAVTTINHWRSFYSVIETFLFGLSLGSVLVLIAIGLAITFGVMGVINMAHGELMMLGAYTTYAVQVAMPLHIGSSVLAAIPAAFIVSGITGIVIERTVIRVLYGRPLETLLATFGISLILQQLVRSIFTALNRSVETPGWMSGTLQVNDALSITYVRLYVLIFSLLVFAALLMVLKYTRIGLEIRAVAQNRAMARAMGIRSEWVDALTFGLGSGVAGVAGVALSQLTNVGPNLGQSYIIDSFLVVVFGGVGNLWGSLLGGMCMGIVDEILEPYAGAVLAKIIVLVALILFIQRRPQGLFPPTGRAAESQ
jgi:urea transport system permease protein